MDYSSGLPPNQPFRFRFLPAHQHPQWGRSQGSERESALLNEMLMEEGGRLQGMAPVRWERKKQSVQPRVPVPSDSEFGLVSLSSWEGLAGPGRALSYRPHRVQFET